MRPSAPDHGPVDGGAGAVRDGAWCACIALLPFVLLRALPAPHRATVRGSMGAAA
jgi:hypothetical protein